MSLRADICECCGEYHTYPADKLSPGAPYYDLCRKCAVEHELEPAEFDWRAEK